MTEKLTRKDEWAGTEIVFRLSPQGVAGMRLDFEHIGLMPVLECYDMCASSWQYCLGSLRQFVETSRGTPFALAESVTY